MLLKQFAYRLGTIQDRARLGRILGYVWSMLVAS